MSVYGTYMVYIHISDDDVFVTEKWQKSEMNGEEGQLFDLFLSMIPADTFGVHKYRRILVISSKGQYIFTFSE
jgi:hypothetical protein